jgi:hypothetical protein
MILPTNSPLFHPARGTVFPFAWFYAAAFCLVSLSSRRSISTVHCKGLSAGRTISFSQTGPNLGIGSLQKLSLTCPGRTQPERTFEKSPVATARATLLARFYFVSRRSLSSILIFPPANNLVAPVF